jgi:hypothetical protein
MKIVWAEEAFDDYHQNIEYLLEEWTEKIALEFIEDVERTLELIKLYPELYPLATTWTLEKQ